MAIFQPHLDDPTERAINFRVATVWALLFFNVIEVGGHTIIPIPHTVSRVMTQAALPVALGLAYSVNRRLSFRPNTFLTLASILAVGGLLISIGVSTFHSDLRAGRVIALVFTLWLLTPWWQRADIVVLRAHLKCLLAVMASVLLGFVISPSVSLFHGRLAGRIWPIPPTQVAHYAAVSAGICAVAFLTKTFSRRVAAGLFLGSLAVLLFTHTRTATAALAVGIILAALTLVPSHQAARRALIVVLLAALVTGGVFRTQVTAWAVRGETTSQVTTLDGREKVWTLLEAAPRSDTQVWFGSGLSNGSFDGLPIDSSWLSLYDELGLFGDILGALLLLALALRAWRSPRGAPRAIAVFLIVYCGIASYTETGLGLPSPYLLDLCAAASLLGPRRGISSSLSEAGLLASIPGGEVT